MAELPESKIYTPRRRRISLVWTVPIAAALVGAWVTATTIMSEGPKITITFDSVEGLEAGKTKIHYKGVDVGTLTTIRLSPDHSRVVAVAQMAPKTEDFLVQGTHFWVVRPRISGANVTGLGTLISGSFIGMEIGASREKQREFVALEAPPVIARKTPGRFFVLKASDLGSLDTGTPIFFRRLQVGEVASYSLDGNGRRFTIKVFVAAPYDHFVTPDTRFWQASGIDMQLSATGLSIQTQSLLSIAVGGIAFETPSDAAEQSEAAEDASFTLYNTRAQAYEPPPRNPQVFELLFTESVRGLAPGAPVEFRGIRIGEVRDIRAQIDTKTFQFSTPVTIELDAQRLGVKAIGVVREEDIATERRKIIDALVSRGVRARLKTANLLTGSAMVDFSVVPGAPVASVDWTRSPVQLPTASGQLEATEAALSDIVTKIDKMPLNEIGINLQKALGDADLALIGARGTFDSANTLVGQNSAQVQELSETLREVRGAARSVRVLADYLERHPEALVRGKTDGPK